MKHALTILFALFALNSFAQDEGAIVKETWTCTNKDITLTAVFTPKAATAKISAYGAENIELKVEGNYEGLEMASTTKLTGELIEHDTWSFAATLVRSGEDFEYSSKKRTTTKAQLSLITDMFIDCVGDRVAADLLECKVVIQRK